MAWPSSRANRFCAAVNDFDTAVIGVGELQR